MLRNKVARPVCAVAFFGRNGTIKQLFTCLRLYKRAIGPR